MVGLVLTDVQATAEAECQQWVESGLKVERQPEPSRTNTEDRFARRELVNGINRGGLD